MNYNLKDNFVTAKYGSNAQVKRGDISIIAASVIKEGNLVVSSNRQRFVWPRGLEDSGSRFLTRRVWGKTR